MRAIPAADVHPVRAISLATMMALAIPFHLVRGEVKEIAINVVLGSLAALVAWGRARTRTDALRRRGRGGRRVNAELSRPA